MNQESAIAAATTAQIDGRRVPRNIKMSSISSLDFEDSEELVGNNPEQRNWKGIFISLGVILAVIGLVIGSVILLTPEISIITVPNVTISDILYERWMIKDAKWIGDKLIYQTAKGGVIEWSPKRTKFSERTLIPKSIMKDHGIVDFRISADRKFALLLFKKKPIYTYSFTASYFVYNIKNKMRTQLMHDGDDILSHVEFGPQGNSLLYYYAGNLYHKKNVSATATEITSNGIHGLYQNGMPDWIYEEEIFKGPAACWWSKSGRYIAFASFDDRKVRNNSVTIYSTNGGYPISVPYKYPKADGLNPVVEVHVYDTVALKAVKTYKSRVTNRERMEILHMVTWSGDEYIVITWSDRTMTSRKTLQYSITSRESEPPLTDSQRAIGAWMTYLDQPPLVDNEIGVRFHIFPNFHGGNGYFNHLAMVNYRKGAVQPTFVTEGNWDVTKLIKFDAVSKWIYYISNEIDPGSRHVYRINLQREKQCITCKLRQRFSNRTFQYTGRYPTKRCGYVDASIGDSSDWLYVKCLGPGLPLGGVVRINQNKTQRVIDVIQPPCPSLYHTVFTNQSFHVLNAVDGHEIRVKVLRPASVHLGERPIVFFKRDFRSQTVNKKFEIGLAAYLSKSIGALVVFVDGTGSRLRGKSLSGESAKHIGKPEIEDMKIVIRFLEKKYEGRVDSRAVAIVGTTGYGGYVAGLSMAEKGFKCGVARSPITDWSLYESFGTERIFGHLSKYNRNSLADRILNDMAGSKLKIYHGIQDRKVNMQHSVLLKQSAMLSERPLDAISVMYHSSTGNKQTDNLKILESKIFKSISSFLKDCLFENSEERLKQLEHFERNYLVGT